METRDDLELKVARINRRLLKLMQEGEHVCQQLTHLPVKLTTSGSSSLRLSRSMPTAWRTRQMT